MISREQAGILPLLREDKTEFSDLRERHPEVPVVPVFLHGLGKSLPRGEGVLIPFICDVFVGEPMRWQETQNGFLSQLEERVEGLAKQARMSNWE